MKKCLLVIGCVACLAPRAVLAAQNSPLSSAAVVPLFVVLLVSIAAGWLWRQWRRGDNEKKAALDQLRFARRIIEQAPVPIVRIDQELHIVETNECALDTYDREPLIGCSLLDLEPQLANHPLVAALQSSERVVLASEETGRCEPHVDSANFGGTLTLVSLADQQFGLWYGQPPTLRMQPGDVAVALSQAEESANRMKSEFIANINHEVRTPMNAIIGYTEMLANSTLLGPKEKRFVAIIHKSSMALVAIFNDIMELSKIDSGRLQIMTSSIRLPTLIREVESLFKDQAEEKGIVLISRIAGHVPQNFILDGTRLKQVLQNLISNAIKFTSEGQVELTVDGSASKAQAGCYDLSFTIQDSGIGIPAADQQKIFELFRQREDTIAKRYGGVGLGLTLCSRLVTMMGGRIDLLSKEGEGARFTVSLGAIPLAEHGPVEQQVCERPPRADQQKTTILVVDDVDLIKDVFIDFFQDSPYNVVTATNGEEALALARSEHPGMIFMDLNLNGMDGRSITEQLRQHAQTSAVPIVVMTGEMLEEDEYKPLFDDFLQKPFRLDALKEIVARYAQPGERADASLETDSHDADEQAFLASMTEQWSDDLERLRHQAVRSGSLVDAATLGEALQRQGETARQPMLIALGRDLQQFANEPNILGVDRLLAKLSRIVNGKTS